METGLHINTMQHTNLTAFVPEALVAAMPHSEASAPGSAKAEFLNTQVYVDKINLHTIGECHYSIF